MSSALRLLRLDDERWAAVDRDSIWAAIVVVAAGWFLLALVRLGGLGATEPRSVLRIALVGVWGWLALAIAIWAIGAAARRTARRSGPAISRTVAAIGLAHVPLLALAGVVFVAAMLLRLSGPGTAAAWFVFALWFPASLAMATRSAVELPLAAASALIAVPYVGWFVLVGRHLLDQIGHLL